MTLLKVDGRWTSFFQLVQATYLFPFSQDRKDLERSLLKVAFINYMIVLLPLLKLGTSFCRYLYCRERIGAKWLNWLQSRFPYLLILDTRSILESFQSGGKAQLKDKSLLEKIDQKKEPGKVRQNGLNILHSPITPSISRCGKSGLGNEVIFFLLLKSNQLYSKTSTVPHSMVSLSTREKVSA